MSQTPKTRLMQMLCGILAVAAMCVSAISACACAHHEPAADEVISCHGGTNELPAEASPESASFDVSCICVTASAAKAVTVKPDQKLFSAGEQSAALMNSFDVGFIREISAVRETSANFPTVEHRHLTPLISSGPSRAPPIL